MTQTVLFVDDEEELRNAGAQTLMLADLPAQMFSCAEDARVGVAQVEKLAQQEKTKRALEAAVADRTSDLRQALFDLKQTQNDLVQAGKLAGLGQMSAALSHELNQPLAAVKTYADNARAFLKRDNVQAADDNLGRISKMADRMASISAHLRNFARRPQQATGPLLLDKVIQ